MNAIQKITIIATALLASSAFAYNGQFDEQNPTWQQQGQTTQQQSQRQSQQPFGEIKQGQQNNSQINRQPQQQTQRQSQQPFGEIKQGQHNNGQFNQQPQRPTQMHQGQPQFNQQQSPMHNQNRAGQPNFAVGEKLPQDYRGKEHRVNYKTHNLPKPAKNQAWVEADGRYLLINVLTNAIVQVLLGN